MRTPRAALRYKSRKTDRYFFAPLSYSSAVIAHRRLRRRTPRSSGQSAAKVRAKLRSAHARLPLNSTHVGPQIGFVLRASQKLGGSALRFVLLGASIASLLVTSAIADSGQIKPSFTGVWTGRIGSLAITACFNDITPSVTYGSYYYQHRLIPINLYGYPDATGKVAAWSESDGKPHPNILYDYDGTWQIEPLPPNRIRGTWSNRSGAKKLPIELTKVDYAIEATEPRGEVESENDASPTKPCSSDAYHKAIEQTVDTFVGPIRTINNFRYRLVARGFPGRTKHADYTDRALFIATVEPIGNSPSIQSINDDLRKRLSSEHEADLLACRRANAPGEEGYFQDISSVSVAGHRLVVNVENRGRCGENGVWPSDNTHMWNLNTGKRESLFLLFSGVDIANKQDLYDVDISEGRLPNALDKLIATRLRQRNDSNRLSWKEIQECYGPYELGAYTYTLKLAANGITFEIPPVRGGACGESLTLTFEELRPFLNKEGRQFAAELRTAQKARR